jgi:hypothetical protein
MAITRGPRQWLLFAYAAGLGINIGGALLATTVIFPVWATSPEAAAAWDRSIDEARFFMLLSPLVLLLAVSSGVVTRRSEAELRWSMRASAVLYVLFFAATLGYFVPGQAALQGDAAASMAHAEHAELLRQWLQLNWIRQSIGILAFALALHSLGLSYRTDASPRDQPSVHDHRVPDGE